MPNPTEVAIIKPTGGFITFNNTKIISNGSVIYLGNFSEISIKNYGLFTNKTLDTGITLAVGNAGNFVFVSSQDLT